MLLPEGLTAIDRVLCSAFGRGHLPEFVLVVVGWRERRSYLHLLLDIAVPSGVVFISCTAS